MYVPVSDDEVPAIVALMNRAYRDTGASAGWNTEAGFITGSRTTVELLRGERTAKPAASLLKWVDDPSDAPMGCVWLEPLGDDLWFLGSLAIRPDLQNGGRGRAMLSAAEQWVLERGGRRVRMTVVNIREALISWYLRRGYRMTGETEAFPYGDNRFGTPLRDDLRFVVLEKDLP